MSGNKFRSVTSNNMGFDLVLIVRYIIMAIQGSAKRLRPGLVNFAVAVAYHFCLSLPASFSQPGRSL